MTQKYSITILLDSLRGGAVAARWAHNPKVASSSLAPATNFVMLIYNILNITNFSMVVFSNKEFRFHT